MWVRRLLRECNALAQSDDPGGVLFRTSSLGGDGTCGMTYKCCKNFPDFSCRYFGSYELQVPIRLKFHGWFIFNGVGKVVAPTCLFELVTLLLLSVRSGGASVLSTFWPSPEDLELGILRLWS